jgi:hypothetical protein
VSPPSSLAGLTPVAATAPLPRRSHSGPRHFSTRWQERYAELVRAVDVGALAGCVTVGVLVARLLLPESWNGAVAGGVATMLATGFALAGGRAW